MINTLSLSLATGGLFAYVGGSPFVFIQLFHVRPEHFGYYFGINAAGLITASQINGRLAMKYSLESIFCRIGVGRRGGVWQRVVAR